jgi:hypothetical protein
LADPVCSAVSLTFGEPLQATASLVRNWVLVEHPGAWGPVALHESGLAPEISSGLASLSRRHGFRVLLIRRPERPGDSSRHCFVAHSGRRARWIEERVVDDVGELLDVDFSTLREGRPPGFGTRRARPLYLVCTNGRHDPCCATLGRPVARALHARSDGAAWECSHFGGDRFAGNLVCLPHGLYFGRLSAEEALAVVDGYERGVIDLDHYRGQAGEAFAAQAAEYFVRRQEGLFGVNDLMVTALARGDDGAVGISLDGPGGRGYEVEVRMRPAEPARPLSCKARGEERPPTYELAELRVR